LQETPEAFDPRRGDCKSVKCEKKRGTSQPSGEGRGWTPGKVPVVISRDPTGDLGPDGARKETAVDTPLVGEILPGEEKTRPRAGREKGNGASPEKEGAKETARTRERSVDLTSGQKKEKTAQSDLRKTGGNRAQNIC